MPLKRTVSLPSLSDNLFCPWITRFPLGKTWVTKTAMAPFKLAAEPFTQLRKVDNGEIHTGLLPVRDHGEVENFPVDLRHQPRQFVVIKDAVGHLQRKFDVIE